MDNPPAFPSRRDEPLLGGGSYRNDRPGMSLRDWFAGQALTEFASLITVTKPDTINVVARLSYEMADAMLLARSPVSDNGEGS